LVASCLVGVGGGAMVEIDLEVWDNDFRINVTSMVLMCRYVIPEMREIERGAIINVSSVSGRMLATFSLQYGSTVDHRSHHTRRWRGKSSR
jgi:NAD(P)-dependent dehydrogenase (short-subunit alcohol dehydrogenase family)